MRRRCAAPRSRACSGQCAGGGAAGLCPFPAFLQAKVAPSLGGALGEGLCSPVEGGSPLLGAVLRR